MNGYHMLVMLFLKLSQKRPGCQKYSPLASSRESPVGGRPHFLGHIDFTRNKFSEVSV